MSGTIDFDKFRAEQQLEPIKFTIGGVTYDLPPTLPASVAVDVIRMKIEIGEDANIPVETLDVFGSSIFGPELWRTVLDRHRVTLEELPTLIRMVLGAYTADEAADDPKEEASPTSPTTESSSAS